MSKDEHNSMMPRRRFPEFKGNGPWSKEQLGEFATIIKGRGISKADVVPDGKTPCVRYAELYTQYGDVIDEVVSRTNLDPASLVLSKAGDVLIPASGETKADIATAACLTRDGVALGSDLNIVRSKLHGPFFSYYLNGSKRFSIAKVAQGDTVAHLYPKQLEQIDIMYPEPTEQRRISNCLGSLDEWITAEADTLAALRRYKTGLMQQLFPRPGEPVPRLRFPEFRSKLKWRRRRIGDVLVKKAKAITLDPDTLYREIGVRSHGKGLFHKDAVLGTVLGTKRVFHVVPNALVFNIVFAWEGAVAVTTEAERGFIASHRFPMFLPRSSQCDVRFMHRFFLTPAGKEILHIASPGGAGRNRTLSQSDLSNLHAVIPDKDEQRRIADCLTSLDANISARRRQVAILHRHKQGMMQQLFPTTEDR